MKVVMIIILSREMDAQLVVNKNLGIYVTMTSPLYAKNYAGMV